MQKGVFQVIACWIQLPEEVVNRIAQNPDRLVGKARLGGEDAQEISTLSDLMAKILYDQAGRPSW